MNTFTPTINATQPAIALPTESDNCTPYRSLNEAIPSCGNFALNMKLFPYTDKWEQLLNAHMNKTNKSVVFDDIDEHVEISLYSNIGMVFISLRSPKHEFTSHIPLKEFGKVLISAGHAIKDWHNAENDREQRGSSSDSDSSY